MNFQKPHYRLVGERYVIMSSELTKAEGSGIPDWMRAKSTGVKLGNIDSSDLKPPKLKLLAGMSPEVMDAVPGAQPGHFWITILNQNLGQSVVITPILLRKSYNVWAPKTQANSDQKGPLATSSDGIKWDTPNQTFKVRFQGNTKEYTWKIGDLVTDFRADKFGSQQPEDSKSKPIATLTYDILVLVELPNGKKQLAVWTSARTGVTPTQNFISTVMASGVDQFYQRFRVVVVKKSGGSGDPYFSYDYQFVGNIQDETEGDYARGLYDQYVKSGFITDMEAEAANIQDAKGHMPRQYSKGANDDEEIPF